MRRATLDEFLRSPIGHWTHAPPVIVWMASPKLAGIMYGGYVSAREVPRLRELADLAFHPALVRPYRALVDCSALTGLDAAAFAFLVQYLQHVSGTAGELVDGVAVVRAPGMPGAASIGLFHDHMAPDLNLQFVDSLDDAIAKLDAGAHREAIHEVAELGASTSVVAALREMLHENSRQALTTVARKLGVSTRTLQRACLAAGSSYRDEVAHARFVLAEELVRATNDKIEVIARRAGYASVTTLTRRFRLVHGVTPSEYRRKRDSAT